jgi:hypothetical protein
MSNLINVSNFKLSIFLTKNYTYIYIYNNTYYCLVKIQKNLKINLKNNKVIEIKEIKTTNLVYKINLFLKQFYFYEFTKIKFTGKGYKIKKNTTKSMILLFNRAHTTTL